MRGSGDGERARRHRRPRHLRRRCARMADRAPLPVGGGRGRARMRCVGVVGGPPRPQEEEVLRPRAGGRRGARPRTRGVRSGHRWLYEGRPTSLSAAPGPGQPGLRSKKVAPPTFPASAPWSMRTPRRARPEESLPTFNVRAGAGRSAEPLEQRTRQRDTLAGRPESNRQLCTARLHPWSRAADPDTGG